MDKIDQDIISELMKDSQTAFSDIAKKLGISPETVRKRYKKMIEKQQIKLNSIAIALPKFGYKTTFCLFLKSAPTHDRTEIIDFLKKVPNIFTITEITGEFEVLADGVVKDLEDLFAIIKEVSRIPAVEQVQFILIDELPRFYI